VRFRLGRTVGHGATVLREQLAPLPLLSLYLSCSEEFNLPLVSIELVAKRKTTMTNAPKLLSVILLSLISQASTGVSAQVSSPDIGFITAQPANEWLARVFIGAKVRNTAGEVVADINDLIFDRSGRISAVVLGVGGILGVGEKNVAIPFNTLVFSSDAVGVRIIIVPGNSEIFKQAPSFMASEKTTLDAVEDKAIELGRKTSEKAGQLKDQAMKKIDEMKQEPKKP
jgi:sporulation protein YlmC with PRC-barrel domain